MAKKTKKNKILVYLNSWSDEFISQVLESIRLCAIEDGVDIFVFTSLVYFSDSSAQNKGQLNLFKLPNPEEFDGAIIFSNTFNLTAEEDQVRELLTKAGLPVVSTEVKLPGMAFVGTDNYKGEYMLTEHLVETHKCKNIVYLSGIDGNKEDAIRRQAVEDCLKKHKMELMDIIHGDFGYYVGRQRINEWIEKNKKVPDAFICANDLSALGAIQAVYDNGYSVPEDVIVTGFDFGKDGRLADPMLASVARDWESMGKVVYEELMRQIDKTNPDVEIMLETKFVPSESCGCKVSKDNLEYKKIKTREEYATRNEFEMLDYFFKNLRAAAVEVKHKEEFNKQVRNIFADCTFLGDNFWLCTEPAFFEIPDDEYASKITRISRKLDVLYSKENNVSQKAYEFNNEDLVPHYKKKKGESNIYVFLPLNHLDKIIGYVVSKNTPQILYNNLTYNWVINMNGIFNQMRSAIFAERANEELKRIYMTDFQTGMFNRTGFNETVSKVINANRKNNKKSLLIFADIDAMKFINDYFGHLKGDLAIKATADALRNSLEGEWYFTRFGGDEFIIIGTLEDDMDAEALRSKLVKDVEVFIKELDPGFPLSVSIGMAEINSKDRNRIEDYIKLADDSMYQEKQEAHQRINEALKKYKK